MIKNIINKRKEYLFGETGSHGCVLVKMEEENRRLRQEIAELTARLELQQSKNEIRSIDTYPARTGTS